MSNSKFINIGKNIFNRDQILSITEIVETVEVERNVAIVNFLDGKSERIILRNEQKLADVLSAENLNFLD